MVLTDPEIWIISNVIIAFVGKFESEIRGKAIQLFFYELV